MRATLPLLALVLAAAATAGAEPSGRCGGGPFAFSSTGAAVVCSTSGPYKGSAEVRSTGGTNFYAVVDGDSTNQGLPSHCLDGYVGWQQGGGHQGVVLEDSGDYAYGPQPQPGPPTVPPCT